MAKPKKKKREQSNYEKRFMFRRQNVGKYRTTKVDENGRTVPKECVYPLSAGYILT